MLLKPSEDFDVISTEMTSKQLEKAETKSQPAEEEEFKSLTRTE